MDVRVEVEAATMGVLFSRVRVTAEKVIATISKVTKTLVTSTLRFISIGGVSLSAVAPDLALYEGPEALV